MCTDLILTEVCQHNDYQFMSTRIPATAILAQPWPVSYWFCVQSKLHLMQFYWITSHTFLKILYRYTQSATTYVNILTRTRSASHILSYVGTRFVHVCCFLSFVFSKFEIGGNDKRNFSNPLLPRNWFRHIACSSVYEHSYFDVICI